MSALEDIETCQDMHIALKHTTDHSHCKANKSTGLPPARQSILHMHSSFLLGQGLPPSQTPLKLIRSQNFERKKKKGLKKGSRGRVMCGRGVGGSVWDGHRDSKLGYCYLYKSVDIHHFQTLHFHPEILLECYFQLSYRFLGIRVICIIGEEDQIFFYSFRSSVHE